MFWTIQAPKNYNDNQSWMTDVRVLMLTDVLSSLNHSQRTPYLDPFVALANCSIRLDLSNEGDRVDGFAGVIEVLSDTHGEILIWGHLSQFICRPCGRLPIHW